ncbi:hypothetical protein GCM10010885_06630 [Alicyclobacillus cellulosilyticus]|uniref:Response regulatory domain-containing protein n=1 Tax=Alicyclobacillus cellulosilyticus TaxID=1003997 RepID=A0A917NH10_9BACL|nr:hypothetical protein GCM10010885_06630 [Alicyclobacillus cellulosilyticus]
MYRVLLVDDEPEVCTGLAMKIDWKTLGVELAGTAYDGEEAIARLEREDVHVVVTDMQMPRLHGVDLLRWCHEHRPQIKLIVLTGYDEFAYAKAAIQTGVQDFLLKPVVREELMQALQRAVERLRAESDAQGALDAYRRLQREQWVLMVAKHGFAEAGAESTESGAQVPERLKAEPVVFVTVSPRGLVLAGGDDAVRLRRLTSVCRAYADEHADVCQFFADPGRVFPLHRGGGRAPRVGQHAAAAPVGGV